MAPDAAYAQAVAQFQACLHAYGGDGFDPQSVAWCGWSAGDAYGAWSALGVIHTWQMVAAVSWLLSAALAALAAWLAWRQRRWRAC